MSDDDQEARAARRPPGIDEDWASVVVGLGLLALILLGVVTNAWVP